MNFFKKKKQADKTEIKAKIDDEKVNATYVNKLGPLEFEPFEDDNSIVSGDLFEIRDLKVIEKIGLVSAGMEPLLHKVESAKNSQKIVSNEGEKLYRVFIPSGSTLMHAKEGKNL